MKMLSARACALFVSFASLVTSCTWVGFAARGGRLTTHVEVPAASQGAMELQVVEASVDRFSESGVRALEARDWSRAATGFENAILTNPSDHQSHFGLGVALEMSGDVARACEHYEKAQKLKPEHAEYKLAVERAHAKLGR
jgi:cytochrome c-type biogenesis protein CcmH/NrfG